MPNPDEVAHWEDRYREQPPWDTGRVSAELVRRLGQYTIPRGRAVELGCGTGTNAVWLAQQGFDVTAIDISPTAIALAETKAKESGVSVRFVAADVTALPNLGPPFAFYFDRGCYHAVRRGSAAGFLRELDRITAPGAWAIVLTGNAREEHKPGPPAVSEETLRAELGSLFDFVSLEEFRFDQAPTDGARHLGWSCVLRKRNTLST
jgi:SAM-dependent methyltransferase